MDRKKLIALAHMAAAQVGADEETRRLVQRQVTGVESCREMDEAALVRLIRHWQRAGAAVRLPYLKAVRAADDRSPLIRKLAAQCHGLGRPFPAYALGVLRQMGCTVERIEWAPAPMLRKAVAALGYQQRREGAR
ncbi:uncharacterized protein DUF1018 [Tibeticola sediminis]|uniref:Uncharacterized protein DUF1018 n=1 Tax=Tibeticola sediminis TaxID=1917811 RepID=A0A3N4V5Y6_9BURK|nr:phage protein GemA/Gp16 family protein [Tibeticola sediminis]RPE72517.1 uncharacterized protein DUF1018 [Tibeticola sediminis]